MKAVNFKPVNDYILLQIPVIADKTDSGIIKSPELMIEERENQDDYFLVVAISDDVKKIRLGQRVMISIQRMNLIAIDNVNYGLVETDSVLGYQPNVLLKDTTKKKE